MADDSKISIKITFWGDEVLEGLRLAPGVVVAIKGARVSDFDGVSLSASADSCSVYVDQVENAEFRRMSSWAKSVGVEQMQDMQCKTQNRQERMGGF